MAERSRNCCLFLFLSLKYSHVISLALYKRGIPISAKIIQKQSPTMMKQLILLIFLIISCHGEPEHWLGQVTEGILQLNIELHQIKNLLHQSILTEESQPSYYPKEEVYWQNEDKTPLESDQTSHQVQKRSPRCLRRCLRQQILHPAQCHSYCRAGF